MSSVPDFKDAVLVIHTNNNGEISESDSKKSKDELEKLRKASNRIDGFESPYKAIVSVLMLKEGWDVRNVTTIVGLRAYAALEASKTIIETFKKKINELTVVDKGSAEIRDYIKLRQTRPFVVKDQGFLVPQKCIFNKIIGDSHLELLFASFLEQCPDIVSYAKNYLAVHFRLDYVTADGSISNYYPDFIVKANEKEIYVIETKGLEDLDVPLKIERLKNWCADINAS